MGTPAATSRDGSGIPSCLALQNLSRTCESGRQDPAVGSFVSTTAMACTSPSCRAAHFGEDSNIASRKRKNVWPRLLTCRGAGQCPQSSRDSARFASRRHEPRSQASHRRAGTAHICEERVLRDRSRMRGTWRRQGRQGCCRNYCGEDPLSIRSNTRGSAKGRRTALPHLRCSPKTAIRGERFNLECGAHARRRREEKPQGNKAHQTLPA